MKKFNKIMSTIAVVILALGLLCTLIGGLNGGFRNMSEINLSLPFGNFSYNYSFGNKDKKETGDFKIANSDDESFDVSEIKNLKIQVGGCQMRIEESEDNKIHVISSSNMRLKNELKGDTLSIKGQNEQVIKNDRKIILSIPKDMSFDDVELDLGAIEMIAEIALQCDDLDLDFGAGDINIKEINAREIEVDSGAANVSFAQAYTENLKCKAGMGNFKYSGDITGKLNLDMSMGNANFKLDSSESMHNYDIDCAAGNVKLGDKQLTGISDKKIDNGADSSFDIDCAMGNVNISFGDKL